MADIGIPPLDHNNPSEIHRGAPVSPDTLDLSQVPPILQLRTTTCVRVGAILDGGKQEVCDATATGLDELKRKAFLEAVRKSLGDEDPTLKQALEVNTVQVYEVPGRDDLYALSLDGKNLDYLYKRNGEFYFDFYTRRRDPLAYTYYLSLLQRRFHLQEKFERGEYTLYKNGVQLSTFSPDYYKEILVAVERILKTGRFLEWLLDDKNKGSLPSFSGH